VTDRDPQRHLDRVADLEPLVETLRDRDAGELFQRDLEEARTLAAVDPRFRELVAGLEQPSLGARMRAVDAFFAGLDPAELVSLPLPPCLAQLRAIYLSSRPA